MNPLFEWAVNPAKLAPLGFTDAHIHFGAGFLAIIAFYFFFRPIIRWFIALNWKKALTFLTVSGIYLFITTWIELYQGLTGTGNMEWRDLANSTLAMISFGIYLFISHLISSIINYMKTRKKKTVPQQNARV
ncbi:hypothetical protein GWK91_03610 [Virgibacillus sp. MSP4-1]|uniref:hypothetical protein n=1 Tax=Virgibacillus sp. MSP4-1 TaxID=2700081 RepID=UPI00039CC0FC|nr:hypothetical protein [Virgibacillus sp. MSP4-1]QHS22085.1 hypothetical protein GWK91_03610 [Virgibacillus sp. MSP4-1]